MPKGRIHRGLFPVEGQRDLHDLGTQQLLMRWVISTMHAFEGTRGLNLCLAHRGICHSRRKTKAKATSGGQAQKAETVALRLDTSVPDSGVHLSRNVAMVLSGSEAGDRRDTPRFAVAFALVRGSRHHPPTAVDN